MVDIDINVKHPRSKCPDGTPNLVDIHVGNRIKIRRGVLGLTQYDLAKMLGMTFQQVQKYEKGLNRVAASRLWDISRILDVDINFFFEDMSEEAISQSPRMFSKFASQIKSENNIPIPVTPENTTEAQILLRNYFNIFDRNLAKHIFELVKQLSHKNISEKIDML